jgi:phytoene dehydrogenase-like protein
MFILYLVLDRDLAAERHAAPNTLVVDGLDPEAPYRGLAAGRLSPSSALYLWNASLSDPHNPRLCGPGQTNLQLSAAAPAAHDFWGAAPGRAAGPRYAARRRELRNRLLDLAERAVPDIRSSIAFEEAATPVTEERLMRTTGASAYGPALTPTQVFARPGFVTPIEGLYLAGASGRGGPGLIGTLRSGVGVASAVTGVPVADLLGEEAEEAQPV